MKAAYELTVLFLRVWLVVGIVLVFVSLSDFAFRRPHGVRLLLRRLLLSALWPLALASSQGRAALFGKLRGM